MKEIKKLSEELPYVWADAYKQTSPHAANIWRIKRDGFEYLFDCSSELVLRGDLASDKAVEDRIVAVHGFSQAVHRRREDSLMRKQPLGPVEFMRTHGDPSYSSQNRYDKGHFIGHALGGCFTLICFLNPSELIVDGLRWESFIEKWRVIVRRIPVLTVSQGRFTLVILAILDLLNLAY